MSSLTQTDFEECLCDLCKHTAADPYEGMSLFVNTFATKTERRHWHREVQRLRRILASDAD